MIDRCWLNKTTNIEFGYDSLILKIQLRIFKTQIEIDSSLKTVGVVVVASTWKESEIP